MRRAADVAEIQCGGRGVTVRRFYRDEAHVCLLAALALLALLVVGLKTWLVLTLSGLAMGTLLFLMASGMSLTFGLMNVLNLAHGAFVSLGAFVAAALLAGLAGADAAETSVWLSALAVMPALGVAALAAGLVGVAFERLVVRPVYGDLLKQILVTVGGAIVLVQLMEVIWGVDPIPVARPPALRGSFVIAPSVPVIGGLALEKYRLVAGALGLVMYVLLQRSLERTRLGILIRAGVENREMVQVLGYRVRWLFLAVFVAGSALAGLGGGLWALYQESVTAHMGDELLVLIIVVIVLGGLGSVRGCFYGALLVGLVNLYVGYLAPHLASVAAVGLMVAVLMWRPQGLIPVTRA